MKKLIMMVMALAMTMTAGAQVLWKVISPDGSTVSHVLGTHHFAPQSFLDSIPGLDDALNASQKVYGEIIMADMMKPEFMMKMQQMMMAPADSTLDRLVAPAQLDSILAVWHEYGTPQIPDQVLPMLKPAAISTQLSALMAMKILPEIDATQGIDQIMQDRGAKLGKTVAGLETPDFQTTLLMGAPMAEQAESLMKMVRNIRHEGEKMVDLTNSYLRQDYDALTLFFQEADKEDADANETLIYCRNDNWVKILGTEMKTTPLLVVVGAGHLVGDRGILNSLRQLGYKVEPAKAGR